MNCKNRTAVLLINTGSPAAPEPEALAGYLYEFLSDRRVVELPSFFWKPLLRFVIIPKRKFASAERYRLVWTEDGSPLVRITKRTAEKMQALLGDAFAVRWAMRYGTQKVSEVLPGILADGPRRVVVLPLFAQYATQTTEACLDAVNEVIAEKGASCPVVRIRQYFDEPGYIDAMAGNISSTWERKEGSVLLMSFHGIPQASSERGDPYEEQCRSTAAAIAAKLGLEEGEWAMSFQSKFGPARWLEPSTVDMAGKLAAGGVKRLAVTCPGFAADCLETLEEIAVDLKGRFIAAGGEEFQYIPALNASDAAAALYAGLSRKAAPGS